MTDLKELRRLADAAGHLAPGQWWMDEKSWNVYYGERGDPRETYPLDQNSDREVSEFQAHANPQTILALLDSLERAMAWMEDAINVIHGEYCGCHQHHPVCRQASATLAEIGKRLEGK